MLTAWRFALTFSIRDICFTDITMVSLSSAATSERVLYMRLAKEPYFKYFTLTCVTYSFHVIEWKILLFKTTVE